jgi:hypothetical protein
MGKIDSGEGGYSIGDELTTLTQLSLGHKLSFTQFANPLSSSALLLQDSSYLLLQNDGHLLLEA